MNEQNANNVRKDFKNCTADKSAEFILSIEKSGQFVRKSYIPINDSSHFERFNYSSGVDRISIVYDTKARMLSITAKQELMDSLAILYNDTSVSEKIDFPIINVSKVAPSVNTEKLTVSEPPKRLIISDKLKQRQSKFQNPVQLKSVSAAPVVQKPPKSQPQTSPLSLLQLQKPLKSPLQGRPQSVLRQSQPQTRLQKPVDNVSHAMPVIANTDFKSASPIESQTAELEYKNGFSVKNCKKEVFDSICKKACAIKGVTTKTSAASVGKPAELVTVEITDLQKQKVYLRYMPRKNSLSLQGRRSGLYTEIHGLLMNGNTDYNTAITSHIKSSGEEQRTSEVERRLKKSIPSAFDFLSEQSKIDLSMGLIDIYNKKTQLSDYSVLLVPPYRALERLIYDLQAAQGINVKMIGQGFEKRDDGSYCLKSGYRKKINSVIYNEVLSALYTEYFRERHSFTHSDNTNSLSVRVIRNIEDVKTKFNNLLMVIDYNGKKLKEIGFGIGNK